MSQRDFDVENAMVVGDYYERPERPNYRRVDRFHPELNPLNEVVKKEESDASDCDV